MVKKQFTTKQILQSAYYTAKTINVVLIGGYLLAIITANLSIVYFGPAAAIWNALILIAFDLTARDGLHEAWHGRHLWLKMLALIGAGSILSWWLNADAKQIAIASFLAFLLAGLGDTAVYQLLGGKSRLIKINGSNVVSSILDTIIFVLVAGLPLWVIPGQIVAKIGGGAIWTFILKLNEERK